LEEESNHEIALMVFFRLEGEKQRATKAPKQEKEKRVWGGGRASQRVICETKKGTGEMSPF